MMIISEPPPIITNFAISPGNDSISSRSVRLTWEIPEFYPATMHTSVQVQDTVIGETKVVSDKIAKYLLRG